MMGMKPRSLFGLSAIEEPEAMPVADAAPVPFTWANGGARMTPDDIAFRRKLAQQNIAAGMDTSPVGHWLQGAARVAQALVGNMEQGRLDKASSANAAESAAALEGMAGGSEQKIAAVLANPYIDQGVKDVAKLQWQATHRAPAQPTEFERAVAAAGIQPGTPEFEKTMRDYVSNKLNPIQAVPYTDEAGNEGLRFIRPNTMQGGGGPASSGSAGASPPSTLPPDFDFDKGGAGSGPRSFPR